MSPSSSAERAAAAAAVAAVAAPALVETRAPDPAPAAAPRAGSPAIYTSRLRKVYRRTVALEGLSMQVGRGEVFGFLGPNGAGKTTAVKLLLGLVPPTSGEAMALGAPVGDIEARRRIGYLPELFRYQSWLTAAEVLTLHCQLLRMPKPRWHGEVGEALATVGLADRRGDKVGGFSKGMQQRLGLGVALLGEPDLVVLDEPTSALDPVGRHQVRDVISGLKARGATVFLNTHLLEEVEHTCDRVAVIDKGETIATGTLAELTGAEPSVRLRVTGLGGAWPEALRRFGRHHEEGDWLVFEAVPPQAVPDLVEAIVGLGGRVSAVIPVRKSLESRFLELLGAP